MKGLFTALYTNIPQKYILIPLINILTEML